MLRLEHSPSTKTANNVQAYKLSLQLTACLQNVYFSLNLNTTFSSIAEDSIPDSETIISIVFKVPFKQNILKQHRLKKITGSSLCTCNNYAPLIIQKVVKKQSELFFLFVHHHTIIRINFHNGHHSLLSVYTRKPINCVKTLTKTVKIIEGFVVNNLERNETR